MKILCTPNFTKSQRLAIDEIAKARGISREEVVRMAVASRCAECVPTHAAAER